MPTWNSAQYLKFDEERTRPCRDLAARVSVDNVHRVIDLGCGPGNSTKVLAERWPQAEITGLDNSREMIATARASHPGHRWIVGDIVEWAETETQNFDVVFSNAALQWVNGHPALFPKLLARTEGFGALAIQVPANLNAPAHQLMRDMASSSTWRDRLPMRIREWHSHDFAFYYDLLAPISSNLDIWETEYIHQLPDADGVVEWYKGSGLRPFLDALPGDVDRDAFIAGYRDGIRRLYPARADGHILFPFRRCFLIAYR